jgi:hypothetical protein
MSAGEDPCLTTKKKKSNFLQLHFLVSLLRSQHSNQVKKYVVYLYENTDKIFKSESNQIWLSSEKNISLITSSKNDQYPNSIRC